MRKILLLFLLTVISIFTIQAQDKIGFSFGQVFSGFKFKDSQGNQDANLSSKINFACLIHYQKEFKSGIFIKPEISFNNLGAKSSFNHTNLDWDMHYLAINLNAGYIYNKYRFKPYTGIGFYYGYLYNANQLIGSDTYDLLETKAISASDMGLNLSLGVRYDYNYNSAVFLELRNSIGLKQLDNNLNGGSKELYNRFSTIQFGIIFNLNRIKVAP
ncbi:MAG: outer membrane beta-barrel protein [Bacteroidales bacterium]